MKKLVSLAAVDVCLAFAPSAGAITFGQLDGNTHPNVGALFADWDPEVPGPDFLCSGTLISPTVFLTASHCTAFLTSVGVEPDEVFVSFESDPADSDGAFTGSQALAGTYDTHPRFGPHFGDGDAHDIAVVVLGHAYTGATPAALPTLNRLGQGEEPGRPALHGRRLRGRAGDQAEQAERPERALLRRRAPLRNPELQHAYEGVAEARDEPAEGKRGHVLRRFRRAALPGHGGRDVSRHRRRAHGQGRRLLPLDRRRLPARHASAHAFLDDFVTLP